MDLLQRIYSYLLTLTFKTIATLYSFLIVRSAVVLFLLPAYVALQGLFSIPVLLQNLPKALSSAGREHFVDACDEYRESEKALARKQLVGSFRFSRSKLLQADLGHCPLKLPTEVIEVCGARVNVFHGVPSGEEKTLSSSSPAGPVILLHGNPSWSWMWRDIMPRLLHQGREVYAIDWIGHGYSDKPCDPSDITFELHVHTLSKVLKQLNVCNGTIVAHDWGGCIALCTVPSLSPTIVSRLVLLNTFFPPRPYDISVRSYLLYLSWFLSTGILDGLLPEELVMRFMAPEITPADAAGFAAPFARTGAKGKASIARFAHIVPALPDAVLGAARLSRAWRLAEGVLGPRRLTNVNAQARLARRGEQIRNFWREVPAGWAALRVKIVFGRQDPLLADFKDVLERGISERVRDGGGVWIEGAGHYPGEEQPAEVARWILAVTDEGDGP
ncbi:haloalkane dehalogenase family protein [Lineolata rhizophorae]|uniref:Haloalkane dehalogenase family protein n=1 Tax=Lineolata rhizophorae TaxID=578093 RepID=A0A6A6NPT9_9PEZI|nr:haloalkane dehalogenase family protein [Lineolata rhizophorae]